MVGALAASRRPFLIVFGSFSIVFGPFSAAFGSFCMVFTPFFPVFSHRGAMAVPRRHRDAVMAAWRRHSADHRCRQPQIPGALMLGLSISEIMALVQF